MTLSQLCLHCTLIFSVLLVWLLILIYVSTFLFHASDENGNGSGSDADLASLGKEKENEENEENEEMKGDKVPEEVRMAVCFYQKRAYLSYMRLIWHLGDAMFATAIFRP